MVREPERYRQIADTSQDSRAFGAGVGVRTHCWRFQISSYGCRMYTIAFIAEADIPARKEGHFMIDLHMITRNVADAIE
jgi:hypothetical protein